MTDPVTFLERMTNAEGRATALEVRADALEEHLTPPTAIAADGAIPVIDSGAFVITKAGIAVLTLAATAINGTRLEITSSTANAHTITATGLFRCGTDKVNVATFAAQAGASLILLSYGSKWYVLSNNLVTFT